MQIPQKEAMPLQAKSGYLNPEEVISYNHLLLSLMRLVLSQLCTDAATRLLMP